MSQRERKRQKAAMKKRSKQKATAKRRAFHHPIRGGASVASQILIRQARNFPIVDCWISDNWQAGYEDEDEGLVQVLISRQQPDGNICLGFYLIDTFCLGLKNTLFEAGLTQTQYQREVPDMFFIEQSAEKCDPELAHQMIYAGVDYAAKFGFTPHKDFSRTQYLLIPRGELPEPYDLTFGKDGKPFFVAGPYDDVKAIVKRLEQTAGPGNFNYLVMVPPDLF